MARAAEIRDGDRAVVIVINSSMFRRRAGARLPAGSQTLGEEGAVCRRIPSSDMAALLVRLSARKKWE